MRRDAHTAGTARLLPVVADFDFARTHAGGFEAVVSLHDDRRATDALRGHGRRHVCLFADTSSPDVAKAPRRRDVEGILEFTAGRPGSLLVHCEYGQSRSPAVALGVAVSWGWAPVDAAQALLSAQPLRRVFAPNELVVGLFDDVLGLGGALRGVAADFVRL